jgi:glycogen debranching enzyme
MTAPGGPTSQEIHLVPLTDDGAPNVPGGHEYLYMPAPSDPAYVIRFEIEGTSSICRQGSLWVNIPEAGKPFNRHSFREFKWVT